MFLLEFLLPNSRSIVLLSVATLPCLLSKPSTAGVELVNLIEERNVMLATALVESALKEMIHKGAEEVSSIDINILTADRFAWKQRRRTKRLFHCTRTWDS